MDDELLTAVVTLYRSDLETAKATVENGWVASKGGWTREILGNLVRQIEEQNARKTPAP